MPSRCILILTRPHCDNLSKELNYLLIYNSKLKRWELLKLHWSITTVSNITPLKYAYEHKIQSTNVKMWEYYGLISDRFRVYFRSGMLSILLFTSLWTCIFFPKVNFKVLVCIIVTKFHSILSQNTAICFFAAPSPNASLCMWNEQQHWAVSLALAQNRLAGLLLCQKAVFYNNQLWNVPHKPLRSD